MQLGQPGVEGPKLLGNGPSLRIVVQTAFECALPVFDFGLNVRNLATNGTWTCIFQFLQVIPVTMSISGLNLNSGSKPRRMRVLLVEALWISGLPW